MADKLLISIFTPSYNRAYLLGQLYQSLLRQTVKNFEWLIVDDGSEDETELLIARFIAENKIQITYCKKENGGKHTAINKGAGLARGGLFFIVDSDDYLTDDAVEKIASYHPKIKSQDFAGVSFRRGFTKDKYIGSPYFEDVELSVLDFRYRKGIKGDMAEVYKTEILRKFPFPEIAGEKFCPEGLIWNRIGQDYKILWTSDIIYLCKYLEDGLTAKINRLRRESPNYSALYYSEFTKLDIPFLYKIKGAVNFWRFAAYSKIPFRQKWNMQPFLLNLAGWPLGSLIRFLKDNREKTS